MGYQGRHTLQKPPKPPPSKQSAPLPKTVPDKPAKKPSREKAIRLWMIIAVALILIPLIGGIVSVKMHGFSFFVFRQAGTGETNGNGLSENQGPGQPDAPKTVCVTVTPKAAAGQ